MCYFLVDTYIGGEKGREHLKRCFSSKEYQEIMAMRAEYVDARALIAEEEEDENSSDQNRFSCDR